MTRPHPTPADYAKATDASRTEMTPDLPAGTQTQQRAEEVRNSSASGRSDAGPGSDMGLRSSAFDPRAGRSGAILHGSALLAERAETYRRLLVEALPFARVELAWMKQRQHVTDEPGMLRNIQAAFASTAMIQGEGIEETVARLWGSPEWRARFARKQEAA